MYNLWTETGGLNEDREEAKSLESGTLPFKSGVVDMWDSLIIRAVILYVLALGNMCQISGERMCTILVNRLED